MNAEFMALVSATVAVLSPLGIALAKNGSWTTLLKTLVPILVSLAIAVAYCLMTDQWQPENVVASVLAVFGLQQLAYTTVLRGLSTKLEASGATSAADKGGRHEAVG